MITGLGTGNTFNVTVFDVPVGCVAQPRLVVIITYNPYPFTNVLLVYVVPVAPGIGFPVLSYHCYVGVAPPPEDVAVSVVLVPEHIVDGFAIATVGVTLLIMDMVTIFDTAGLPVVQVTEEVN